MTDYFAYGSNMSQAQINARLGGHISQPKPARLSGFKLVFNKYSKSRTNEYDRTKGYDLGTTRVGAANIVATGNPDDIVEGVVYSLSDTQLKKLDKLEGIGSGRSTAYKREQRVLQDGLSADIYIANIPEVDPDNSLKPSASYVKLFLTANQLSPFYREKLLNVEVADGGTVKDHMVTCLNKYIERVEGYKKNSAIDYRHGFWFFKNARAKSREANYLFAKKLVAKLEDNQRIDDVPELRRKLISKNPHLKTMTDRGVNSSELNAIIKGMNRL